MKRYLLSVVILASSSAFAGSDYDGCIDNIQTEICQAYFAGISHGKENVDIAEVGELEDSFRSRALEQRVGERYRKTVQTENKNIQVSNL
ncbi:hypothetical protein C9J48_17210 [Photobacterium profundum]|uniref:Uncharacterized protein n=1 Tax=Photobacterium profundum 3TCK TaxID=314280 RepID=Q1Z386_9GAMM|nr:hypothetical protein [Photobacterium profundum]EAS42903.1 hypothetical protein P3TCK_13848 [Photobacterium profundum 3TCK]PSV60880.1 hypothetical protein C9J48_17210 [Photobacterium profundum]